MICLRPWTSITLLIFQEVMIMNFWICTLQGHQCHPRRNVEKHEGGRKVKVRGRSPSFGREAETKAPQLLEEEEVVTAIFFM